MGICRRSCCQLTGTVAIAVTAVICFPMASQAAQWASPTNGTFQDGGRWSPNGVPGTTDIASFPHPGTYTVGFSDNATTDRLDITAGAVTLDLGSRIYTALKSTGVSFLPASLHINGPDAPSLTVTEGLLEIQSAVLGEGAGKSGELILKGASTLFDAKEILFLGQGGKGNVFVREGATGMAKAAYVGISSDSNNAITVLGLGSRFTITDRLDIGNFGGSGSAGALLDGELVVGELILASETGSVGEVTGFDGGHVHIQGDALLGSASGNHGGEATLRALEFGRITIDGALKYDHNSRLQINGSLDVGSMTRTSDLPHTESFVTWYLGSLRVRSDVTTFDLGFSNLSHQSRLHVDGDLHLDTRRPFSIQHVYDLVTAGSLSGNGQFEFTAGTLTLGTLSIGTDPGMRQSFAVDGEFASTTQLAVTGVTDIQQGGHLELSKATGTFDGLVVNSGSLHINQSQVAFNGTGDLGFQGLLSTGSLSIRDSTVAGTVMPGPGASFQVDGEVTFNGPVKTQVDITRPVGTDRPKINLNSEFHMGTVANQTTTITIEADMALGPASKLVFGVGGTNPGEYDALQIEGVVTLGGTLEVSLLSGYTPSPGDRIPFITAGRLVGTFSEFDLPTLPGGMTLDMERLQLGELLVLSGLPGDYNNDGTVDAADFVVWRNALGTPVTLTNDSTLGVNADDYERWKANYGRSVVAALVAARQVPEPRGIAPALLLLGFVARKVAGYRGRLPGGGE